MSKHGKPRRTALRIATQICVVLALIGGVVMLVDRGLDRQRQADKVSDGVVAEERGPVDRPTDLFDPHPSLLLVGDSFAEGAGDPAIEKAYPLLVGDAFGWSTTVDARGARGFLPTDISNLGVTKPVPPVVDRLDYDAANYKADYIIIDSGRNDLGKDPARLAAAMDDYATRLRAAYPKAVIVLMVPSYFSPVEAANYPLIAPAFGTVAEKIGAYVIDPHAEGWYEGVDLTPLLWEDGVHPSARGHEFYAERLSDALKRLGIEPFQVPARGAG